MPTLTVSAPVPGNQRVRRVARAGRNQSPIGAPAARRIGETTHTKQRHGVFPQAADFRRGLLLGKGFRQQQPRAQPHGPSPHHQPVALCAGGTPRPATVNAVVSCLTGAASEISRRSA